MNNNCGSVAQSYSKQRNGTLVSFTRGFGAGVFMCQDVYTLLIEWFCISVDQTPQASIGRVQPLIDPRFNRFRFRLTKSVDFLVNCASKR